MCVRVADEDRRQTLNVKVMNIQLHVASCQSQLAPPTRPACLPVCSLIGPAPAGWLAVLCVYRCMSNRF